MPARNKRIPLPKIEDCNDCGACCTQQEGLPLSLITASPSESVNPLPPELIAELLATKERLYREGGIRKNSDCLWYDPDLQQCRHYEYRPIICRDLVKVGDEYCRHWRQVTGVD